MLRNISKFIGVASLSLLVPMVANAATISYDADNTVQFLYDTDGETVDLGNRNLAEGPLSIQASFAGAFADRNATGAGGLNFGVFADPYRPRASGSIDVNIVGVSLADISGTFGGEAITFKESDGDLTAELSAKFADISDIQSFALMFTGANRGDQLQVNLAASPVPLPAGILLFGTALGGLGLMRRRKKA